MFSSKFFSANRKKLARIAGVDLVVLSANGLLQRSADTTFTFRQDSNFWYFCGVDVPDAVLVLDIKNDTSFIILPPRLKHRDQWEGALDKQELSTLSGIHTIYDYKQGWQYLNELISKSSSVGSIVPSRAYEQNYGMHVNPAKLVFKRKLKLATGSRLKDIRQSVASLRQIKTAEELTAIQQAVTITAQSLKIVKDALPNLKSEKDIQTLLSYEFAKKGANGHAYDPIIACGKNSATIHYEQNDSELLQGRMLLLDVGAQYGRYAADISRTWAIGQVDERQMQVHAAVLRVHAYAMGLLKPGVLLRQYEQEVRENMKKELRQLGLIDENDTKNHLKYYPHLTSHFLGVDVHDAGVYDTPLVPNMVLTVEPGIYIADESIGVRIEDDVVITADGCKNLSADIPTDLLY